MTLAVVVASVLLAAQPGAVSSTTPEACAHVLDSVAPSATSSGCPSPASLSTTVAPDATTPPAPPQRLPSILPGEIGFVAVVTGLVGGGLVFGAWSTDPRRLDDDGLWRQRALLVSGTSLVGLAGLVGAGAVATAVFDPSTGTLRLPLFSGDD